MQGASGLVPFHLLRTLYLINTTITFNFRIPHKGWNQGDIHTATTLMNVFTNCKNEVKRGEKGCCP